MSDLRDASGTVERAMLRAPKTLPASSAVGDVRALLAQAHVHMALLTEDDVLRGTLVAGDLDGAADTDAALPLAHLGDRSVGARADVGEAHAAMLARDVRRLAVVDEDGRLLGLLCLKRRRDGFCSDDDVAARAGDRLT